MKKQNYIALILLLSGALSAVADTAPPYVPLPPPPTAVSAGAGTPQGTGIPPNQELVRDFCPPAETLVKDTTTQHWSAPNGWASLSPSFLRSSGSFVGVQWVGIGVGEIICIYAKPGRSTFPILLQRRKLAPAPLSGGVWSEDKGGYMECKSDDIKQCPFFIQVPKKEENVYEQLDFYKGKPVESY